MAVSGLSLHHVVRNIRGLLYPFSGRGLLYNAGEGNGQLADGNFTGLGQPDCRGFLHVLGRMALLPIGRETRVNLAVFQSFIAYLFGYQEKK